MATQGVSKFGLFFSLTSKVLAVSFVAGLGLAACSGDADMTDEIVQPVYGVDAPEGAPLDVTAPSNSAESSSGEKPVAAPEDAAAAAVASDLGMSAEPVAPAVSEEVAPPPPAETLAEGSDTVKAELTDVGVETTSVAAAPDADTSGAMFDQNTKPRLTGEVYTVSSPGAAQNLPDKPHRGHAHKGATHSATANDLALAAKVTKSRESSQYVIEPGDTLATISQKIYGTTKFWLNLAQSNGINDANRIFPGDVLRFETTEVKAKEFVKNYKTTMKSVVVKKGDSLSKIAAQTYGSAEAWPRLLSFNRDKIRDPNKIPVGLKLNYMEGGKVAAGTPAADPVKPAAVGKKAKSKVGH
jgi:nucleoid-associated protein YgaU